MIVDYIDSHRESFGVEPICAVLAEAGIVIAPSTYYARRQARLTDTEMDDAYLANQLRSLWQDNWGVYGARKLWHAARRAGHDLGRDQVARLMRLAGIAGTVRGRHRTMTTQRDQTAPRHPDLVKRGWHAPTGLDQLWVADFERHEAFANPGGGGRPPLDACRSRRVEAGGRSIASAWGWLVEQSSTTTSRPSTARWGGLG
jgi:putative transposase